MARLLATFLTIVSLDVAAEVWFQAEKDGSAIECPDVVVIDDSKYEILNDCYGLDPKHPLVESGMVVVNKETVSFVEREVAQSTFVGQGARDSQFERSKHGDGVIRLRKGPEVFYFTVRDCLHGSC